MKKFLLLLITLLAFSIFVIQIDDDLTAEVTNLRDKIETPAESNAYRYLIGAFANENEKIVLPEGELFCNTWDDGCIDALFNTEADIEALRIEHQTLISRVDKFHSFGEYKTLSKPSANEQLPPYPYIAAAERIKLLNAISDHKKGKTEQAIESLLNQFAILRRSLELQDNMVGKLVFLMKLSEIIDVLSIMLVETGTRTDLISSLTTQERDMTVASAREFAMSYSSFKELDKHPEFFQMGGYSPGWFTRMVYKPNMTINSVAPIYSRFARLSTLTSAEFAQAVEGGGDAVIYSSKLRNYAGNILMNSFPNYDEYVAKFMDFEGKLTLFNHRHHYQDDLTNASNPYYENEGPEIAEDAACFRGPFEDKRFLRCLRLQI